MSKVLQYGKSYLLWYAYDLIDFGLQEFNAVTKTFGIQYEWQENPSTSKPYVLVNFSSSSDVAKLMSRSVTIKSAYELWGTNNTLAGLHSDLANIPKMFLDPYSRKNTSFRILVETFGKKLSAKHKLEKINELDFLKFQGPVNLRDPQNTFLFMEYYGTEQNKQPDLPYQYFFGRWVADGQRSVSTSMSLRTRKFIGNTTMDPLLSLIMANLAGVKNGDVVLDPFVGTGGLLTAAAHYGGYVLGTDIDYLTLHAKAKPSRQNQKVREPDESVRSNLKQYGYESRYLDIIVADSSLPLWTRPRIFDAIITDPPYGIREPTEKIGSCKSCRIPDHLAQDHIPSKVSYGLHEIIEDLLDFSSVYLRLNGRLVYWMPSFNEDFDKNKLPYHPCLELLSYCRQPLASHSSRYLITMEKVKENVNAMEKSQVLSFTETFRKKYFDHRKKST